MTILAIVFHMAKIGCEEISTREIMNGRNKLNFLIFSPLCGIERGKQTKKRSYPRVGRLESIDHEFPSVIKRLKRKKKGKTRVRLVH